MAITAAMIKELRELTGAGMSTCKEALVEADGNIEKAIEVLREKGQAAAVKKAGRIASEGLSLAYITEDKKVGVVVEVNSETDFVAKNSEFQSFVKSVAKHAANSKAKDIDGLMEEKWIEDETITVKEALTQKIAVIGENLNIRRFSRFVNEGNGYMVSYMHAGGKVAVLVEFETDTNSDKLEEAGKNVAMQVAAMNPRFKTKSDVPEEFISKEKEILTQQTENDPKCAGKNEKAIENIITGRLNKELKEMCLVDQEYVKNDKMTVSQYIDSVAKEIGGNISIKGFIRFETGEGLEKKEENFAEEVSKTMGN